MHTQAGILPGNFKKVPPGCIKAGVEQKIRKITLVG